MNVCGYVQAVEIVRNKCIAQVHISWGWKLINSIHKVFEMSFLCGNVQNACVDKILLALADEIYLITKPIVFHDRNVRYVSRLHPWRRSTIKLTTHEESNSNEKLFIFLRQLRQRISNWIKRLRNVEEVHFTPHHSLRIPSRPDSRANVEK